MQLQCLVLFTVLRRDKTPVHTDHQPSSWFTVGDHPTRCTKGRAYYDLCTCGKQILCNVWFLRILKYLDGINNPSVTLRNIIMCNMIWTYQKMESFVSLATLTCNVWCSMLSCIYQCIWHHFKHSVQTFISAGAWCDGVCERATGGRQSDEHG